MKILHDIHTHSVLSSCCGDFEATTENYIKAELELGMKTFGLSNHVWDESIRGASGWYGYQTIRKARESKTVIDHVSHDGLKCLFGIETEYYGMSDNLGISEEGAKNFDYLLIPFSHTHMVNFVIPELPEITEARKDLASKAKESWTFMNDDDIDALFRSMNPNTVKKYVPEIKTDVIDYTVRNTVEYFKGLLANEKFTRLCKDMPISIAHPFAYGGIPNAEKNEYMKRLDDNTIRECFSGAKKAGAYLEINLSAFVEVNDDFNDNDAFRYFRIAKEEGCKFTFGTDSHSVKTLPLIRRANEISQILGLKKNDIAEFLQDSVEE